MRIIAVGSRRYLAEGDAIVGVVNECSATSLCDEIVGHIISNDPWLHWSQRCCSVTSMSVRNPNDGWNKWTRNKCASLRMRRIRKDRASKCSSNKWNRAKWDDWSRLKACVQINGVSNRFRNPWFTWSTNTASNQRKRLSWKET